MGWASHTRHGLSKGQSVSLKRKIEWRERSDIPSGRLNQVNDEGIGSVRVNEMDCTHPKAIIDKLLLET